MEWVIDNKYYTAAVHFVCRDVGHVGITTSGKHGDGSGHGYDDGEVPVVMYLFTGQVSGTFLHTLEMTGLLKWYAI